MRPDQFLKTTCLIAIVAGSAACARLEGGNWPSLREGFTPRQPAANEAEAPAALAQDTAHPTDQDTQSSVAPDALQARLDAGLLSLEEKIRQAEAASSDSGGSAWYAAQLELTRLSRLLDEVRPYPGALTTLEQALRSAKTRLTRIKPDSE